MISLMYSKIGTFYIYISQINRSIIFFFLLPLSGLGIRLILAEWDAFESIPLLSALWNSLKSSAIGFFLENFV